MEIDRFGSQLQAVIKTAGMNNDNAFI